MSAYLPKDSAGAGQYAEGGGLYALGEVGRGLRKVPLTCSITPPSPPLPFLPPLGLVHANHGRPIMPYLMKETRTHTEEAVRHGGCLGLGLAAMGTADEGRQSTGSRTQSGTLACLLLCRYLRSLEGLLESR